MITNFKDFKKMLNENYTDNTQFYSYKIDKGRLLSKNELIEHLKPNFFRALKENEIELENEPLKALFVSLKKEDNVEVLRVNIN